MFIAKTIAEIRSQLAAQSEKKIAFVPTMGALHDGHLALVKKAAELAEIVVVSIYVNKAQFNDLRDYEKYPRQVELDLQKLKNSGATHVFLPQDSEISATDFAPKALPNYLVDCLCGKTRVGHFEGVAMIVFKLFKIVKPQLVVLGQKDFQQVLVIKKLIEDFNFNIEVFAHEIVREKTGLAMSSRNQNLSEEAKIKAANIFCILSEIKNEVINNKKTIAEILQKKRQELLNGGFEKIDYLEIRDEKNLQLISEFNQKIPARIFIAVYLTGVRLIDNMSL
jgi:pantoate--beta-alanine ligase